MSDTATLEAALVDFFCSPLERGASTQING